ncbi:DinB family protein [Tersicoccus sp. MR15.9]|uniref:DinB family protein n=1 Tax=Tersicoccus mangrovi TaxID=3121635 RepID=UPI002FE63491
MAFLAVPVGSEADALATFIEQQLRQLRLTARGLSDEFARRTVPPSTLSIAGLVAHVSLATHTWLVRVQVAPEQASDARLQQDRPAVLAGTWYAGSEIPEGASLADLLEAYDDVAARVRPVTESVPLDVAVPVPEAPWFPQDVDFWTVRWVFMHLATEVARHAGHADLIREALDGKVAYELNAEADGQPWDPTYGGRGDGSAGPEPEDSTA